MASVVKPTDAKSPCLLEMSDSSEQLILITSGLSSSDKNFVSIPVSKVGDYLKKVKECYERTQPTEADATRKLNRVYIDIDGELDNDTSELDFDKLVKDINKALIELFNDNVAIKESCKWKNTDKQGYTKNKISYTIHYKKLAGTKKAIKHYVSSIVLVNLQAKLKDIIKVINTERKCMKTDYTDTLIIDLSVYSEKGRKMRMLGQNKPNENRPHKLVIGSLEDTLITYIPEDCEILKEPQSILYLTEIREPTDENPKAESVAHTEYTIVSNPTEEDAKRKELILEVLNHIGQHRWDSYTDWIRIGFIMNNEDFSLNEYIELSKKSNKWVPSTSPSYTKKKWDSFVKSNLSQVLLWKWLSEDNLAKYMELSEKRIDFWLLLKNQSQGETARFYYNLKADSYIYNESLGWFQLTRYNTWKSYEKQRPSGLLADIFHTFKKVIREHQGQISVSETDDEKAKVMNAKVKSLIRFRNSIGSTSFIDGVIKFLQDCYNDDELDQKLNNKLELFGFRNKVYDLDKHELRDYRPDDYVSITTGYNYPEKRFPEARIQLVATIRSIFELDEEIEKNPNEFSALTTYVLKTLAMCLHGRKKYEKFFVWTGTGSNGKGLLSDMLLRVLGNYYQIISPNVLTKPSSSKDGTCSALAQAQGKRCVMSEEPEEDDKLQVGMLKEFTGGGKISVRQLWREAITMVIQFVLFIQTNNPPTLSKPCGGIERRLEMVPFNNKFVDNPTEKFHRKINRDLKESICKSPEWRDELWFILLDAYKLLVSDGLEKPQCVIEKTKTYMDKQNPLKEWFEETYTKENLPKNNKNFWIGSEYLRKQYQLKGKDIASDKFKAFMESMGLESKEVKHPFSAYRYEMTKIFDKWVGNWVMTENKAGRYWLGIKRINAPNPPEDK